MKKRDSRIIEFLLKNGYTQDSDDVNYEYISFNKSGVSSIHISEDDIVFVDNSGDWLHIPLNYYALIGALIDFRQIAINYESVGAKNAITVENDEEYNCCEDEKNGWSSHCKTCGKPLVY